MAEIERLEMATCPFVNLPKKKRTQWALTREEMKNCVWLRPELVAQVEFTEWTPGQTLAALEILRLER
jgi:ATP-dependent DNA ligase